MSLVSVEGSSLTSLHLADVFADAVALGAERPFLIAGGRRLTYAQVDREAQVFAAALSDLGIAAGDRIATVLPNRPEAVTALLAAARLGATLVPVNPALAYHELSFQLRHAGVSAVVAIESWQDRDYLEWFDELVAEIPEIRHVIAVGGEDVWYEDRVVGYADLLARGAHGHVKGAARDPESLIALLYTSGTLGKPKGVCLSHRSVMGNAARTAAALGVRQDDVSLLAVPHFTIFGTSLIAGAITAGASLVLVETFSAAEAVARMAEEGVTLCHGVPTMFALLLRERGFSRERLGRLRTGIVAGSPVEAGLVRAVRAVCEVEIAYGLTETGPTVTMTRAADPAELRETTVGRALPGVELRLLEPGDGAAAELAVKGPGVMAGYDRMPSETRRAFTEDGFFRTGDLATVDADGYVRIAGRRKESIIRGGFNVHPREVEEVLRAHPAVEDVCVVGVPHEVLGEMICACIVPTEGAIVRSGDLIAYAREAMADYKVPDLVCRFDAFPLSASGKVKRRELARMVAEELTAST